MRRNDYIPAIVILFATFAVEKFNNDCGFDIYTKVNSLTPSDAYMRR